ncbi:hypothetical protein NQ317_019789 [Molorchus minor]|uniref:E3 ubiquitin-protein ligase listerin n=1 Tax=Molorchus minor TaxID=1323400 RepID=A0ABQ9K672_9CUCU|nr:hypothetical protein NQ317_019789 [Molorchus minor]
MGGKHKVANRTKNNARPSSSGRSAELLGSSIPQFIGFSGVKDSNLGLAGFSLGTTEELDASLDPNIQLGLQELAELLKNSEQESVKAVLPVWPRFYNNLATDVDNRVREASHNVHHQIVLKAKRNIAPFLKQLMAPWFTSIYDTYPPAASTAFQAFKDAFPKNKFQEAIVHCQEEILSYINDKLLVQTAQTLSNTKQVSAEDAEAKYERSFDILPPRLLFVLGKNNIQNVASLNNDIVSNSKFWKLAKHKVPPVRAAWFKVLTIICQKAVFLLDGKSPQVVSAVIGNLEENEPTVLPYVWEALLLMTSNIKEWWTFVNGDKLFFPKLWKILKQGGQGNATVIYPSLLPLISHFPPTINENSHQFYNTFFENLRLGLKQKTVTSSRSESVAVATAFIECLQYVTLIKQTEIPLCKTLIKNHLLATIEWCLIEDQASYKSIFNQITSLVVFWNRNSQSETFNICMEFFFENVSDLFHEILFNVKDNINYDIVSTCLKQMEFLQSLKHISKPKRQFKVTFSNEQPEIVDNAPDTTNSVIESDKRYLKRLNLLVFNTCADYVKYIEEKKSKELFEHLCSLIVEFDTKNFFLDLHHKMKQKDEDAQFMDIYNNLLYKWLTMSELCCKQVVDLIFLLFMYVNGDDKAFILRTLLEVCNDDCLGWCISEALSHPHSKEASVRAWLQNDKVSAFLVSICEKEINDECPPELDVLFKLALTENEDGEIIDKLTTVLDNFADYSLTIDSCSSRAAYICALIYTENLLLTYSDKLLLSLFKLACKSHINTEVISTETVYEVNTAWQDAITLLSTSLSKAEIQVLTAKFANVIEDEYLNNEIEENHLDHLTNVIVTYLRAIYRSLPLSLGDFLIIFLNRTFIPDWKSSISNLCKVSEYVSGNLSSPFGKIETPTVVEEVDILKYFAWTFVKHGVVASNLKDQFEEEDDGEEFEDSNKKPVIILNVVDDSDEYTLSTLYDICIAQSYLKNFKNTKRYEEILHYYVLTEMNFKETINNSDSVFLSKLRQKKCINDGWFWCKAAYCLYSDMVTQPLKDIFNEFVKDVTEKDNVGVIHLTQVFSEHIDYDDVQNQFSAVGNAIVLRSLIHCNEIDVQIAEVFKEIEKIRRQNIPQFLYDPQYCTNLAWERSQEIVEIIRLCSSLMRNKFTSLSRRHWDFGVLSLVSWASNCLKGWASYEKYEFQALLSAIVSLFTNTDNQIQKIKEDNVKSDYIDEWEQILVESIHADLAQLWLNLAEKLETNPNIIHFPLIREVGTVVDNIRQSFIFKFNDSSMAKWTKFLKRSCSLLISPQPALQLWGYKMLHELVPGLIKIDAEAVNTNTPHRKGLIFEQFKEKLVETQDIVNTMLMGFKLGEDSCRVEPSTDSFTYTFAYLLMWDVLLTLCEQSAAELRYQYADWLRNEDLLTNFLNNLFRLMPSKVLHFNESGRQSKRFKKYFMSKPDMDIKDSYNSDKIEYIVCWLYALVLSQLPALVRQWWTNLDTKVAQVVDKITSAYISPYLTLQELNDVMKHHSKFKNMSIKVHPSVGEVVAIYTVDEAQMELVITLPVNYPLGSLEVQCDRQIGGTTHKQWLLQLKKCVLHQNGRLSDGLALWNNNLDKKFDGVEECYICFAVLHPGTYQLPKLSCQTCKKKFHSACLVRFQNGAGFH